jgi:hypothetical protein
MRIEPLLIVEGRFARHLPDLWQGDSSRRAY